MKEHYYFWITIWLIVVILTIITLFWHPAVYALIIFALIILSLYIIEFIKEINYENKHK